MHFKGLKFQVAGAYFQAGEVSPNLVEKWNKKKERQKE